MEKDGHVFHLFVISTKNSEHLQKYLLENDIKTQVHYPMPPHLAECYRYLGYAKDSFPIAEKKAIEIVSLPIYNGMRKEEIEYVINIINNY